jgi:LCP family protein required for cell wall assembly
MSRYGHAHRRGLRLTGKILLWLVVVALVAAGGLGGGVWLYLEESVATIVDNSKVIQQQFEDEGVPLEIPEPGKATNALIVGYDARKGAEADVGRSDTVMLVRADPATDTISLLSFPRDLVVDHPGCRAHPTPWRDKINTAFTLCGPSGTAKTVRQLTGLPINYVITVDFHGFKELVVKVGGVYVDVDQRYYNPTGGDYARINLQPGYQRLSGGAALDFARYRHTDSDFHRIARQQQFVKAFKQAVQSNFSITKLPGIINVVVDSVQVAGKKQLDLETLLSYARFVYELPSGSFFQARLSQSEVTGFSDLSASPEAIQAAVSDFLNPDVKAAEKADAVAAGQTPQGEPPSPDTTTIEVLNGNGKDFSATTAADLLAERGYLAESAGNALDEAGNAKWDYFQTQVVYNGAVPGAEAAAEAVGRLFGDYEVIEAASDDPIETTLRVIVGQTFHDTLAQAPVDETPEYQPPATVRDFDEVLPYVREVSGTLDFKVLVPLWREQSSNLDTAGVPFRAYRLEGHDAVKIVYRSARGYWGIMQTSWTEPPILDGPNVQRQAGGRTLRLYYSGSKLHMVAFEEKGAVYWVTNTLLDDLSNETMIAIAKGLKPLSAAK